MLVKHLFLALNAVVLVRSNSYLSTSLTFQIRAAVPPHPMITSAAILRDVSSAVVDRRLLESDRRDPNKESLLDWQERMIAAGKLWRPEVTTRNGTIRRRDGDTEFSLANIACGFTTGEESEYDQAVTDFCNVVREGTAVAYTGIQYILQGAIDDLGEPISTIFYILQVGSGWLIDAMLGEVCEDMYNELDEACNGATGASATGSFSNPSMGSTTGDVEGQFYAQDDGATCPATLFTTSDYCTATVY